MTEIRLFRAPKVTKVTTSRVHAREEATGLAGLGLRVAPFRHRIGDAVRRDGDTAGLPWGRVSEAAGTRQGYDTRATPFRALVRTGPNGVGMNQ